jgi:hypothetical protein
MEQYRLVLKKRIKIMLLLTLFAAFLQSAIIFDIFDLTSEMGFLGGVVSGFQTGLLSAIMVIFIIISIRYLLIMKDEKKLKLMYNAENDERKIMIKQKSGGNVIIANSVIIIFAGIIAGYFNVIVFYSLVACGMFGIYFCLLLQLYYSKKY